MIKLDRALAKIEHEDGHLICGGGARLPQAAARAAALGLAGIEFGVNIPGTVGGAVQDERERLRRRAPARARVGRRLHRATGTEQAPPGPARLRLPALEPAGRARSSRALRSRSSRASTEAIKARARATCAPAARPRSRPASRPSARPSRIPDDPKAEGRTAGQLLEAAGCRGLAVGGARFSPKHANFIENVGGRATTADVLALMAEGRRRVRERFGVSLEAEVQLLGDVAVPDA